MTSLSTGPTVRHPPQDASAPAPQDAEGARKAVVSFFNEQDLIRALAPLAHLARRQRWVKAQLVAADLCVMLACFMLGRLPVWWREDMGVGHALSAWWSSIGEVRLTLFSVVALAAVGWMWAVQGHYTASRRKPWWDEARDMFHVIVIAALADTMILYLAKLPASRLWTGMTWSLILICLPLARLLMRHSLLKAGLLTQPYVLLGHPEDVEKAAAALASEPLLGYQPVAVVSPQAGERLVDLGGNHPFAPMALTASVRQFLAKPGPYQLVGVLGGHNDNWLHQLSQELMLTRDDLVMVPALGGLPMYGMEASHFFSHEVLLLRTRNNLNRRGPQMLKRALDVVGASLALLALSPLLAVVAWKIRSESQGPVFFVQNRVGVNGQPFKFIKFRSMVLDADAALERWKQEHPELHAQYVANNFKLSNDPRVTRIGNFIRRTSIDELPQLINVLRGEMSLVGPRPLLPRELPEYGQAITAYGKARPGITGLWQVNGRSASSFQHRINMDLWYVRNWSLWYDLVILLRTVRVVLRQEGAC